jgi:hypothetical protein
MRRNRGAQLGNTNALKHGLYSSRARRAEILLPDPVSLAELSSEIELLRVVTRRFLQAQNELEGSLDLKAHLSILRATALSVESIRRMVRARMVLAGAPPEPPMPGPEETPSSPDGSDSAPGA